MVKTAGPKMKTVAMRHAKVQWFEINKADML